MRAITCSRYGPADVLQLRDVAKPTPKDGEILIRAMAAEATKSDCEMRSFKFAVTWFWLPMRIAFGIRRPRRQILGGYFSGVVEALGAKVSGYSVGYAVFGTTGLRLGAYGEYVVVPATATIHEETGTEEVKCRNPGAECTFLEPDALDHADSVFRRQRSGPGEAFGCGRLSRKSGIQGRSAHF